MIEIGHNLQNAIEFGMLLSAIVAAVHIVMKFLTKIDFKINQCTKKTLRKEQLEKRWNWIEEHPGTIIGCCWLLVAIISFISVAILLL